MRVDCALLCDAVTVREGLLHILGGGVTRLGRETWPAPLGVSLALRIVVHPTEFDNPHEVQIILQAEDGERYATMGIAFEAASAPDLLPGEESSLPLAVPLASVGIPTPGGYSIEVLIDKIHQISVPFLATETPAS